MRVLTDEDVDFVIEDYLKDVSTDIKNKIGEVIKQDKECFTQLHQEKILQSRLNDIDCSNIKLDILLQKLWFKMELSEFAKASIHYYEWSCGNYCENSHKQMNKKIFCIDEDNYYYVRKPGKLLVRRERPSKMPSGNPYHAERYCDCLVLPFVPEINNLTISYTEPEQKPPKTNSNTVKRSIPLKPEPIATSKEFFQGEIKESSRTGLVVGILIFFVVLIIIFLLL